MPRADLVLDHEHDAVLEHHQVGPPAHPGNQKFKAEEREWKLPCQHPEVLDLVLPSGTLGWLKGEWELSSKAPEEVLIGKPGQLRRGCGDVGAVHEVLLPQRLQPINVFGCRMFVSFPGDRGGSAKLSPLFTSLLLLSSLWRWKEEEQCES
jgi:hypothetical protein